MPEMAHAGENHGHAVLISCGDHLGITHGATGLDYRADTCFSRRINAITEWEEGI